MITNLEVEALKRLFLPSESEELDEELDEDEDFPILLNFIRLKTPLQKNSGRYQCLSDSMITANESKLLSYR